MCIRDRGTIDATVHFKFTDAQVGLKGFDTVSYTHLDVYKRQQYGEPEPDRKSPACCRLLPGGGNCDAQCPFFPGIAAAECLSLIHIFGAVKEIPGVRNYVSIDGGMTDNPRYALYQSAYDVLIADRAAEDKSCLLYTSRPFIPIWCARR